MSTYVYFHIMPSTETVIYVGIGNKYRAFDFNRRSNFWKAVTAKHGLPVVHIVHEDLSWEDACEKEKFYIQKFGRRTLGTGNLVNIADGGDGPHGVPCSEENKKKLSALWSGSKRPPRSEETKRRVSIGLKKAYELNPILKIACRRIPSPETRQKMSLSHMGKIPWNKGKTGIYSAETLRKISARSLGNTYRRGTKHTMEARQKMALASMGNHSHLGFKHSEETKLKMSIDRRGVPRKPHSEITKQRMREAYWRRKGLPCPTEGKGGSKSN